MHSHRRSAQQTLAYHIPGRKDTLHYVSLFSIKSRIPKETFKYTFAV